MVSHEEFVKEIRTVIGSLGLLELKTQRFLAKGFNPDILVMCGCDQGDRVFIEAINTRGSLNRDLGGLFKLKANLELRKFKYRKIIAVCSDRINDDDLKDSYALVGAHPGFLLMRLADLRGCLNQIIVETTREKLDQIDKEKLEWYFDKACPACGEYHKIGSMRQPGKPIKYMCGRCRFEWIKEKT